MQFKFAAFQRLFLTICPSDAQICLLGRFYFYECNYKHRYSKTPYKRNMKAVFHQFLNKNNARQVFTCKALFFISNFRIAHLHPSAQYTFCFFRCYMQHVNQKLFRFWHIGFFNLAQRIQNYIIITLHHQ